MSAFTATLLLIEFLDEVIFNFVGAAMPRIRGDLGLSYAQIGLLLTLPLLAGNLIEPLLGVLGDVWRRKALIVGGGIALALAMTAFATARTFPVLLIAMVASYPASGAFVTLSQATLMDVNPGREEQMMARWTAVGSMGYIVGPLMVTLAFAAGFGWRGLYLGLAVGAAVLAIALWRRPFDRRRGDASEADERYGLREVLKAIGDSKLLRWLALTHAADLMLDILLGFVALYFHDVLGLSDAGASAAVLVATSAGFIGDLLLIPLLDRVKGLTLVRWTAVVVLVLYIAWLGINWLPAKYILLALIQLGVIGWYQVLQGRAYAALPGKSGTVMAASSIVGFVSSLIPLGLGLVAERFGLTAAMWLLAVGPVSLILFLPYDGP